MIVDWHAHVYPPEIARQRRWGNIYPLTIENLLEAHERAGVDLCVVSNTLHYIKDKPPGQALGYIRRWNEYAAEIQQRYGERTVAFASAVPGGGKEFVAET
jgi:hypothetical protein